MAVAAYTYDKLPAAEQQALPNEGHLVAALEWAEPGSIHEEKPAQLIGQGSAEAHVAEWEIRGCGRCAGRADYVSAVGR